MNVLGNTSLANVSVLNKYNLQSMQLRDIAYDEYFVQILALRCKTLLGVWCVSKIISNKFVIYIFSGLICMMLGGILTMAILTNGVWGILFFISSFLPHGIFYLLVYLIWRNHDDSFKGKTFLIIVLTLIGCLCEAYVSPFILGYVIKI